MYILSRKARTTYNLDWRKYYCFSFFVVPIRNSMLLVPVREGAVVDVVKQQEIVVCNVNNQQLCAS